MSWFPPIKLSKCTILINNFLATMTFVVDTNILTFSNHRRLGTMNRSLLVRTAGEKSPVIHSEWTIYQLERKAFNEASVWWIAEFWLVPKCCIVFTLLPALAPCRTFCSPTSQRKEIAAFLCPWMESWPFHPCSAPTRATTSAKPSL